LDNAGTVTRVLVDPDHHFLLRRHWGEVERFTLHAPNAKTVELAGNFMAKPMAATRSGDDWTVEVPMPEGRYLYLWRVDGKSPSDLEAIAAVKAPSSDSTARAGVRTVRPLVHLDDRDAR
jgi:1,4-alpha-glucan branching enzyme